MSEVKTPSDLKGKCALVTGGGSGIGAAVASEFRTRGAEVCIADINDKALAHFEKIDGVRTFACDIGNAAAVTEMFSDIERHYDGLDFLVNNTGIAGPTALPDEIDFEEWDRVLRVNISGMFYCVHHALPLMKRQSGGAIVNVSSAAIRRGGFPMRLPYATSKSAVIGFTETLAMDAGPYGIRVNTVLPGTVEGPRVDAVLAAKSKITGESVEALRRQVMKATSLRTNVEPEDIAKTVAFLCSDDARYVSGQTISVCGNFEGHRSAETDQC
ncbi:MAG: SDR family oxidoreductase [Pseudomonadota bacterium]